MREIRYRAFDPVAKVMEYDVNIDDGKPVKKGYQWFNEGNTVYHSDLMQFTDVKDRNGKGIYEGDILKTFISDDISMEVVFWKKGAFCINAPGWGLLDTLLSWNSDKVEVVGNIHENPELLSTDN